MSALKNILELEAFVAAGVVGDKVIETKYNEIKFDNFVPQAKKRKILTIIPNCKHKGWFGNSYTINNNFNLEAYTILYDYLVDKNIITAKVNKASLWTWDKVYTINRQLIHPDSLKVIINKHNKDFPLLLKCFNIHYDKLYDLFKNYKYDALNEFTNLNKKTKAKSKSIKNKTKKTL